VTALYDAEVPRDDRPIAGYRTAAEHLDDALQHTAPALAKHLEAQLPKPKVLELADAIRRAVHLANRRHAAVVLAEARDQVETLWADAGLAECEAEEIGTDGL
jgi:hypothetical protein